MVFHGNARGYGMVNKVVLGRAALSDLAVWYTHERMCADEGVWILNECVLLWLLMVAGYNWMINVLTKILIYYQFFAYFLCIWIARRYILSYILTAVYFLNFAACFSKLFCTQYMYINLFWVHYQSQFSFSCAQTWQNWLNKHYLLNINSPSSEQPFHLKMHAAAKYTRRALFRKFNLNWTNAQPGIYEAQCVYIQRLSGLHLGVYSYFHGHSFRCAFIRYWS